MDLRCKNYCFTSFKDAPPAWEPEIMEYLVFQQERSPETGRLHWQGYMELKYQLRVKTLMEKCVYYSSVHFEKRRGSALAARNYCMKDESRIGDAPIEYGVFTGRPSTSEHLKLGDAIKHVENGGRLSLLDKMILVNKHKGLLFLSGLVKHTRPPVDVYWFYGKTGTGKSFLARKMYPDAYVKDNSKWWDGYDLEDAVIIDEFRKNSDISYDRLLSLLDPYPYRCEVKGAYTTIIASVVIITSNYWPWQIYEHWEELERRISCFYVFPEKFVYVNKESIPKFIIKNATQTQTLIQEATNLY